jgi:hypothetical protein
MGYAANHPKHQNVTAICNLCGANITRNANQSANVVCLICQAAILNRIFEVRLERANQEEHNSGLTRLQLIPGTG